MSDIGTVLETQRRYDYPVTIDLRVWECPACGIVYGIPVDFADSLRKKGGSYYCPNGHGLSWHETEEDRQRKRATAAERRATQAEDTARAQRHRAETAERSAIAYRGHLTRIKNRIVAGVCPVPGCKRTGLVQTMRHISAKHPAWHAEHAHEL
jgi:uncharacterized Zn finger protein (UPF0148 family)